MNSQQNKYKINNKHNINKNNNTTNINTTLDDEDNLNLYNLQQLLQFHNNILDGIDTSTTTMDYGQDVVDGRENIAATSTATNSAATTATVDDIQNLQLTQWWFLMMQQTIFNFKTTFEQQQQIANNNNNCSSNMFTNNNETVAATTSSSVTEANTNHFDIFNIFNANIAEDHLQNMNTNNAAFSAVTAAIAAAIEQQHK